MDPSNIYNRPPNLYGISSHTEEKCEQPGSHEQGKLPEIDPEIRLRNYQSNPDDPLSFISQLINNKQTLAKINENLDEHQASQIFKDLEEIVDGCYALQQKTSSEIISDLKDKKRVDFVVKAHVLSKIKPGGNSVPNSMGISIIRDEENQVVRFRIMDKSLGIVAGMSSDSLKVTYRLPDILIPFEEFDKATPDHTTLGDTLVKALKPAGKNKVDKNKYLERLLKFGHYDDNDQILNPNLSEEMFTAKRTNERDLENSLKLLIKDRLIGQGYNKKQIDQIFWSLSYIKLANEIPKNPPMDESDEFYNSYEYHDLRPKISSFLRTSLKLFHTGIISEDHLKRAEKLSHLLPSNGATNINKRTLPQTLSIDKEAVTVKIPKVPENSTFYEIKSSQTTAPDSIDTSRPNFEKIRLHNQNFLKDLKEFQDIFRQKLEKGQYEEVILCIDELFESLPEVNDANFWKQFKDQNSVAITRLLKEITLQALQAARLAQESTQNDYSFFQAKILDHSYVLTINLIDNIKRSGISKWQIWDPLDSVRGRKLTSLQGDEAQRFYKNRQFLIERNKKSLQENPQQNEFKTGGAPIGSCPYKLFENGGTTTWNSFKTSRAIPFFDNTREFLHLFSKNRYRYDFLNPRQSQDMSTHAFQILWETLDSSENGTTEEGLKNLITLVLLSQYEWENIDFENLKFKLNDFKLSLSSNEQLQIGLEYTENNRSIFFENPSMNSITTPDDYERGFYNGYDLTENLLSVKELPEGLDIDSQSFHELARIIQGPKELRVHGMLSWCERNIEYLERHDYQVLVETAFLGIDTLLTTLGNEPESIVKIRKFLEKAIIKYNSFPGAHQSSAFWIRLSYHLETHFAKIDPITSNLNITKLQDAAVKLQDNESLSVDERAQLTLQRILMMGHLKMGSLNDADLMTLSQLWVKSIAFPVEKSSKNAWLEREAKMICLKHRQQIDNYLKDPTHRNQAFKEIEQFNSDSSAGNWEGAYPYYFNGILEISLENKILKRNGFYLGIEWPEQLSEDPTVTKFVKPNESAFVKDNYLETKNGEFKFYLNDNQTHVVRRISAGEIAGEFTLLHPEDFEKFILPHELTDDPNNTVWLERGDGNRLVILDEIDMPLCVLKDDQFHYVDENGIISDLVWVKSEAIPDELMNFFYEIDSDANPIFWSKDGKISEVHLENNQKFKFIQSQIPNKGLSENTLVELRFLDFPEDILAEEQGQDLPEVYGVLRLINKEGKPKIIIPSKELPLNNSYFEYEFDAEETHLIPTTDTAAVFLIYTYASIGKYAEALFYLKKLNPLKPFDSNSLILIEKMMKQENGDSAFLLHLANEVIDNERIHLQSSQSSLNPVSIGFWKRVSIHYQKWAQKNSARNQMFNTPFELPIHVQKSILNRLKQKLKETETETETETHWNDILENYYQLKVKNADISIQRTVPFQDTTFNDDSVVNVAKEHIRLQRRWWAEAGVLRQENHINNQNDYSHKRFSLKTAQNAFKHYYHRVINANDPSIDGELHYWSTDFDEEAAYYLSILQIVRFHVRKGEKFESFNNNNNPLTIGNHIKKIMESFSSKDQQKGRAPIKNTPQPLIIKPSDGNKAPSRPIKQIDKSEVGVSYIEKPFEDLFSTYFSKQQSEFEHGADSPFHGMELETPLGQKMLEGLEMARLQNQSKATYTYHLNHDVDMSAIINTQYATVKGNCDSTKEKIENRLNDISETSSIVIQRKLGLKPKLTLQEIFPYFQSQKMEDLKELNPTLTPAQINDIHQLMNEYLTERVKLDRLQEIKIKIGHTQPPYPSELIHEIGEILDKERLYDPNKYPFILLYEYATGKFLRPRQAEILQWIFTERNPEKLKQLLFEFEAGGGKTKVVATLLIFQLIEDGLLPIFFSIPELKEITKEDLRDSLSQTVQSKLKTLEISLHQQLDVKDLSQIYEDLNLWRETKKCCLMDPETYHSLWLQYRFALEKKETEKIGLLSKILFECFNGYCAFLIDEGHRNADPLWQAIIAGGEPTYLKESEKNQFIKIYQILREDDRLNLLQNQQRSTAHLHRKILADTAKKIIDDFDHSIFSTNKQKAAQQKKALLDYFTDKSQDFPDSLSTIDESNKELILLTRGMLLFILPTTLVLEGHIDYGPSQHPNDPIVSPRKNKKPSLASYESEDMSAALSVQRYNQSGLGKEDFEPLMKKLFELHLQEQNDNILTKTGETPSMEMFLDWQQGHSTIYRIDQISLANPIQKERLIDAIGKNPKVIDFYLFNSVLTEVKKPRMHIASSYANLLDGGKETIAFSATLGMAEQYLYETASENSNVGFRDDLAFKTAVAERMLHPRNSQIDWIKPCDPIDVYNDIFEKDPKSFDRLKGILNVGGWAGDKDTSVWAEEFMSFNQSKNLGFNGVVYIDEKTGQIMLLINIKNKRFSYPLKGSDLNNSLKQIGLDPKELKLFKIYGPSQTTGTDLFMEPDAEMVVMLGESITFDGLIQANMRLRQFLKKQANLKDGQGVRWIGPLQMQNLLKKDEGNYSVKSVIEYSLKNQEQKLQNLLIARSTAGIDHVLHNVVDEKLKLHIDDPEEQARIFHQHRNAFVTDKKRNLSKAYGVPVDEQGESTTVLESFYKKRLEESNLTDSSNDPTKNPDVTSQNNAVVRGIIKQASQLIPRMPTGSNNNQGEMTQHFENVQHMEQALIVQKPEIRDIPERQSVVSDLNYAQTTLTLKDIFENSDRKISTNELFDSEGFFAPYSFYLENAVRIAKSNDGKNKRRYDRLDRNQERGWDYLKPPMWYLAVEEPNSEPPKRIFAALSDFDAEEYRKQIHDPNLSDLNVVLLSADGNVVCQKGFEDVAQVPWITTEIVRSNVARGENSKPHQLLESLVNDPENLKKLPELVERVQEIHADTNSIRIKSLNETYNKALFALEGQQSISQRSDEQTPQARNKAVPSSILTRTNNQSVSSNQSIEQPKRIEKSQTITQPKTVQKTVQKTKPNFVVRAFKFFIVAPVMFVFKMVGFIGNALIVTPLKWFIYYPFRWVYRKIR